MLEQVPVLYSFRRCPFAIRARLAIYFSKIRVEIREVKLKDKPKEMTKISKKSTVPVLKLKYATLDESLDIIIWALGINDRLGLLKPYLEEKDYTLRTISLFDNDFKYHLDRYKYTSRFSDKGFFKGKEYHRKSATRYLHKLESSIKEKKNIFIYKGKLSILDICIFPLVRQFRIADPDWFDDYFSNSFFSFWLSNLMKKNFFKKVMIKYPEWKKNRQKQYFSFNDNNFFLKKNEKL